MREALSVHVLSVQPTDALFTGAMEHPAAPAPGGKTRDV
jgi:hypothetical protein